MKKRKEQERERKIILEKENRLIVPTKSYYKGKNRLKYEALNLWRCLWRNQNQY